MSATILKPGLMTTIQDLGRIGWQAFGVPVGGAMDQKAAKLVNILLENDENAAILEMTLIGASLSFHHSTVIAVYGADMSPTLNGQPLRHGQLIQVRKGDIITFGHAKKGMRCYLGVRGGFSVPDVLRSKSTNMKAAFGGLNGRKLESGDVLPFTPFLGAPKHGWGLSTEWGLYLQNNTSIRFVKGKQYDWFTDQSKKNFTKQTFTIKPESDRMGYRLSGTSIELQEETEMITEGTAFGSIQIPPDGQPIILMADRQPTGGYPKIGDVISIDLPKLSQMRPGDTFLFEEISIKEAQALLFKEKKKLNILKIACHLKWREIKNVSN